MARLIHPTAIVDPAAELADDVEVGPYAIVEGDVRIGEGTRVGPHAFVGAGTRMGRDNRIHAGAFVGGDSQDMKYRGERAYLLMGDRNVVREAATVNRATGEEQATRIGNDNLIMAYAHVAHNCVLGNHVVMANAATLAGLVTISDHAIIGGLCAIHQHCRIGRHAIAGGKTKVVQDIPPFFLADGHPARPHGLNIVGLRRHGFTDDRIAALKDAYRALYLSGLRLKDAVAAMRRRHPDSADVEELAAFVEQSRRGVVRPRRRG